MQNTVIQAFFVNSANNFLIELLVPAPTGSGGPMLRPPGLPPVHPRSKGESLTLLPPCIESLSLINFASLSGSSGNSFCWTSSLPLMMGWVRPGQTMLYFPTPIICPKFRFFMTFFPTVFPLPRFFPALLTLLTPFHKRSAGTINHCQMELSFAYKNKKRLTLSNCEAAELYFDDETEKNVQFIRHEDKRLKK